jgi:hypothetical protein
MADLAKPSVFASLYLPYGSGEPTYRIVVRMADFAFGSIRPMIYLLSESAIGL